MPKNGLPLRQTRLSSPLVPYKSGTSWDVIAEFVEEPDLMIAFQEKGIGYMYARNALGCRGKE